MNGLIPVFIFVILSCLAVLTIRVIYRRVKWSSEYWGFNIRQIPCPRCGTLMPRIRKPRTNRQALWGGWTCSSCGSEINKAGIDITSTIDLERSQRRNVGVKPFDKSGRSPLERVLNESDPE